MDEIPPQRRIDMGYKTMKCQWCDAEDQKSIVYAPGGGFSTLMATFSYYDEGGRYHHHDPNDHTEVYRCSRGHQWELTTSAKCPSCDYGGRRDIQQILPAPEAKRPLGED